MSALELENGDTDFIITIKRFLLNHYLDSLQTTDERSLFMKMDAGLPDDLRSKININTSTEVFVGNLVDESYKCGKLPDGKYALIAILDGVSRRLGREAWYEISELKVQAIKIINEPGQAYVSLILDYDYDTYMPVRSDGVNKFSDICNAINEKNKQRNKGTGKKIYPYFNIDPWILCNCDMLENDWFRLAQYLKDDRFIALLVDTSLFDSSKQARIGCRNNLLNVLKLAVTFQASLGIACVQNWQIKSPDIPKEIEPFFEYKPGDIDSIAYFLWTKYDEWSKRKRVGGSVTAGVAPP